MRRKAFTLVELISVSALGLLLFSLFITVLYTLLRHDRSTEVGIQLDEIRASLLHYYLDTGRFPTGSDSVALEKLLRNTDSTPGWRGPYIRTGRQIRDPWNRPILYRRGANVDGVPIALLLSRGPNGRLDSKLNNWTSPNWRPSGDDYALKVTARDPVGVLEERTYNTLRFAAGMVYAANRSVL